MKPHEERVIIERKELVEKLDKLKSFIKSNSMFNKLSEADKDLLEHQQIIMEDYSAILAERIAKFNI